jgi:hypothetical protein
VKNQEITTRRFLPDKCSTSLPADTVSDDSEAYCGPGDVFIFDCCDYIA